MFAPRQMRTFISYRPISCPWKYTFAPYSTKFHFFLFWQMRVEIKHKKEGNCGFVCSLKSKVDGCPPGLPTDIFYQIISVGKKGIQHTGVIHKRENGAWAECLTTAPRETMLKRLWRPRPTSTLTPQHPHTTCMLLLHSLTIVRGREQNVTKC